jgi:DNA-binding CsgD family transcriptional regulator
MAKQASEMFVSFGVISPLKQSYNEYYSKRNEWRNRGSALYFPGYVNIDQEMCPRDVLERSEFYNDCLKRFGVAYSMGAVIAREGSRAPTLTSLRGPRKPRFEEAERKVAQEVLRHLRRAWTIQQHLEILIAGETVLDGLPLGAMFLAGDGSVLYSNRAAEKILNAEDGLFLQAGVLAATDRNANVRLRMLVESALSPVRTRGPAGVSAPRPSLRREYQVAAGPLRASLRQFTGMRAPAAVVLIADPEQYEPPSVELVRQIFKLTRKEAEIAVRLSEGKSIEQTAEELSITYETARTHLRRIFSKTGTSRQTELLLLMARLPRLGNGDPRG